MKIEILKKELKLTNKQISEFFGYKNSLSYRNSSAKKRIEIGICNFYAFVKSKAGGQKENKTVQPDNAD